MGWWTENGLKWLENLKGGIKSPPCCPAACQQLKGGMGWYRVVLGGIQTDPMILFYFERSYLTQKIILSTFYAFLPYPFLGIFGKIGHHWCWYIHTYFEFIDLHKQQTTSLITRVTRPSFLRDQKFLATRWWQKLGPKWNHFYYTLPMF